MKPIKPIEGQLSLFDIAVNDRDFKVGDNVKIAYGWDFKGNRYIKGKILELLDNGWIKSKTVINGKEDILSCASCCVVSKII